MRKDLELGYKKDVLDAKRRELGLGPLTSTISDEDGTLITITGYDEDDAMAGRINNLRGLTHNGSLTGLPTLFIGVLLPGN